MYKYKGELGAWKIDYFLGKGKTEENVTHLEWTAVAATPDYATAGKPPLIDGDTILLNLGTSAVIIVKDASLDGIKKRLKKVFNLTLTSAEETTQL